MFASQPDPVCVYASDSLAYAALRNGRISVVVDPAKEPLYNSAVDGPLGERISLAIYLPIPDHLDSNIFVAVLVLAHISAPPQAAAAEARPQQVGEDLVEQLKLVSVMLSAPLSRSVALQAAEMRLSECENPPVRRCLFTLVVSSISGFISCIF